MNKFIFGTLFIIILSILFNLFNYYESTNIIEKETFKSFNRYLNNETKLNKSFSRIAVGYNTNVDLIVDGLNLLKELNLDPSNGLLKPSDDIESIESFYNSFLYFFEKGSAAERIITNGDICRLIIEASQRLDDKHYYIGGNAGLMAKSLAETQSSILLAGNLQENLRELMPSNIEFVHSDKPPSIGDIHLIMEFKKNSKWGKYLSPRSNRFIVHCDESNSRIDLLEGFEKALNSFKPELVVISGLHLLGKMDRNYQIKRLDDVLRTISNIDMNIPIHLELASIGSQEYLDLLLSKVIVNVNSIGLNEQEMGAIDYAIKSKISKIDDDPIKYITEKFKDPNYERIIESIKRLFSIETESKRKLERIHFHSYKFHILSTRLDGMFSNGTNAAILGSLEASKKACNIDHIGENDFDKFIVSFATVDQNYDPKNPLKIWVEDGIEHIFVPVINCKNPYKTVGLGDSISSMGLVNHYLKKK